jgi:putative MATE family efflux protein
MIANNGENTNDDKLYLVKINNGKTIVSKYTGLVESEKEQVEDEAIKLCFSETVTNIIKIGLPMTLFFLSLYLEQTISLSFIGKTYGNHDMINAMGIVNLYIDCAYFSLVMGLLGGLDTLLSNALATGNYYLFGLYIHRSRLITYIISVGLVIFHYFYGLKVMSLFGIDKTTLEYCQQFFYPSLVYVLFMIQFNINYRVLSILDRSKVCVYLIVTTTVLHPLWCYLCINVWKFGITGAGFSLVITQVLNTVISSLYLHLHHPRRETYFCINADCFVGWIDYLKFTLPSAFMLFADSMAMELQAVFAIFMTKEDYALHIIVSNIANIFVTMTHGFGVAATVMIAEKIAKNLIKESKAIAIYSFILAEIVMSGIVIILILFRNSIIGLFIDDESLISKGGALVVVLALAEIFDITYGVLSCIYKGLGKQRQASVIAFVQFYVIQTVLTYILGIKLGFGVIGIWLSILTGNLLATLIYLFFLTRFNFEQINKETTERLEKDQKLILKDVLN